MDKKDHLLSQVVQQLASSAVGLMSAAEARLAEKERTAIQPPKSSGGYDVEISYPVAKGYIPLPTGLPQSP